MHLTEKSHLYSFLTGLIILILVLVIYIISFLRQYKNRIEFFRLQVIRDIHLIEKERNRIAQDLHDDLGNVLANVRMGLEAIYKLLPNERIVTETIDHLYKTVDRVKALSHNLVPQTLKEQGFIAAVDELLFELSSDSLRYKLTTKGQDTVFAENNSLFLFRVVQEIITNTIKHAKATIIMADIHIDHWQVHITIADNGIGFNPKQISDNHSLGLSNIRSRLKLLKASHTMDSGPNKGTSYQIIIPLSSLTNP